MNQVLTIARKEIVDGLRDFRSVLASLFYALMGPGVVGLVSVAVGTKSSGAVVLTGMMAIFTLVSAFVGGMNVAMDTVAGERERKSLLPLLLNAVPRERIVIGKWLAVSFFAVAGLVINIAGFAVVLVISGMRPAIGFRALLVLGCGLLSLPLLAASVQLLISTASHAVKEAQTYLSLVVFLPMAIGMFLVFSKAAEHGWLVYVPLVGQQMQLVSWMNGQTVDMWQPLVLGCLTVTVSVLGLLISNNRLHRDEILYGN